MNTIDKDQLLKFLDKRIERCKEYAERFPDCLEYIEGCEFTFQFIKNVLIGKETVDDLEINND